eukprot:TRINITY_DN7573_c2_g1_i2.p1 TRINITY_DN7573_c2_g1~~TRINITY_DN7573_c2_g1_i2.p1  ORF type:complete len:533 (+),score=128.98 TRINITY_DN7573_c2_g1_i2:76-1674(+)
MSYRNGPSKGSGGKSGTGSKGGNRTGSGAPALRQSDLLVPLLPFSTKYRSIQEHKARNPHRKYFNEDMIGVSAEWVNAEDGTLECRVHEAAELTVNDEGVAFKEISKPTSEDNLVNVRVFLTTGITAQSPQRDLKHVLRRLDIIGASIPSESRMLTLYGGIMENAADSALISNLIDIVKTQSGLDLSLVSKWTKLGEIQYDGKPDTVVFFPHLWGVPDLQINPQVKTVVEQLEEEETEQIPLSEEERTEIVNSRKAEDSTEGADQTTEEVPETKTVTKTVTRTSEKQVSSIVPTKIAMATLHEYNLAGNTSTETIELCTAVDIFDEWLKREFATKLADTLHAKQAEARRKLEETKRRQEEESSRKRKREEEEESCRKRKAIKIEELKKVWEAEDVGKTDEDKKESDAERQAALKALEAQEKAEVARLMANEAADAKKEPEKKKRGFRVQSLYDTFQYFDRPRGLTSTNNNLSREWLAQQLLCLDKQRTYGDALDLTTLNGLYTKTHPLNYSTFSTEERFVDEEEAQAEVASE